MEQGWLVNYLLGVRAIKQEITERMEAGGARLGTGSFLHARVPPSGKAAPASFAIAVVPYNGPRQEASFSAEEVMGSAAGVDADTSAKIEELVGRFRSFRDDKAGYLRRTDARSRAVQRWHAARTPMYGGSTHLPRKP